MYRIADTLGFKRFDVLCNLIKYPSRNRVDFVTVLGDGDEIDWANGGSIFSDPANQGFIATDNAMDAAQDSW